MGQSNTRSACTGLFDSPMLLVLMAQSHAYAYGTVPHVPYAYGTVPYVLYAYGTVPYAYGTVPYAYIYIAIIIDHPVPSKFTGILWHWIIYFTLNNIQTPMNMYYLTVKMDLCPNKHATKATTAISVV